MMRTRNHIKNIKAPVLVLVLILTFVFVLGLTGTSFAVAVGGDEHGSPLKAFLLQVLNFAISIAVLVWFGRKPISKFFSDRVSTIEKSISEATEAKEAALSALDKVQKKLDTKDVEIDKMVQTAREAGKHEREHLIKEGERMSARIIEQARAGIDFELKQAREALKADAAGLALKLAEEKIGRALGPDEHKKLMEDAIKRLEAQV